MAAALLAAGCGGQSDAELVADCVDEASDTFAAEWRTLYRDLSVPEEAAGETARRFCEEAVRQDLHELDPSSSEFRDTLQAFVRDNPDVMYPVCEGSAAAGLAALPPELQTAEMSAASRESARRYCDIAVEEGLVDFAAPTDPERVHEAIDRIYREHPELVAPTCVLGAMSVYESQPLVLDGVEVSPERAEPYFERVCTEAAASGTFSGSSLELTPAQETQLEEISGRVLEQMIAAGELP